jgi:hypothetical protein
MFYLHTSLKNAIINNDIKSFNLLLCNKKYNIKMILRIFEDNCETLSSEILKAFFCHDNYKTYFISSVNSVTFEGYLIWNNTLLYKIFDIIKKIKTKKTKDIYLSIIDFYSVNDVDMDLMNTVVFFYNNDNYEVASYLLDLMDQGIVDNLILQHINSNIYLSLRDYKKTIKKIELF